VGHNHQIQIEAGSRETDLRCIRPLSLQPALPQHPKGQSRVTAGRNVSIIDPHKYEIVFGDSVAIGSRSTEEGCYGCPAGKPQ
jgi:hypothetical protein